MKQDDTVHTGRSKNNRLLSSPHKHAAQHTDHTSCCRQAFAIAGSFSWYAKNPISKTFSGYCLHILHWQLFAQGEALLADPKACHAEQPDILVCGLCQI